MSDDTRKPSLGSERRPARDREVVLQRMEAQLKHFTPHEVAPARLGAPVRVSINRGLVASSPRRAISFVLPAYNEEANIEKAIESTIAAGERHCEEFEVLVVDDGSSDRTAELAARAARRHSSVRLIRHVANRGYGDALRSGFEHAQMDFVFFTDADNQFEMEELPRLLEWAGKADIVAGFRLRRRDPLLRRINAWAWNRLVRVMFCVPVRDIDCAFKLFRRSALAGVDIESRGAMINTEIMVKLCRSGSTVVEVGVTHLPRTAGDASGADVRVVFRALRDVLRMRRVLVTFEPTTQPGLGDVDVVPATSVV